ncbi:MAG TPA: hypothetical protein VJ001_09770 [Rhodocyclaceae bacterium]|nr:hypothetical protein [Rhodocyclaceae bacterium]
MTQPLKLQSVEQTIDRIIEKVGKKIVFCMPLGIGKPNGLINALYRRVKADPTLHLKILTALSLEKPKGKSDLEQRFLEPLAKRVFEDYLDMDYVLDARKKSLPPNVELYEFFMKTGDYMNNRPAQEHFLYTNYSHAARDAIIQGANVYAQCLGVDESGPTPRYSLSSNPDLTTDVRRIFNEQAGGKPLVMIGLVNRKMPFMPNDAEVPESTFDILIDDPIGTHAPFAPPNMKVDLQDYAIALWASTLVRDGGTLQIGIGSLGDGISHALITRDKHNSEYRQMLKELQAATGKALPAEAELGRFEQGLYGCSEMFVNGFLRLINAGVVRREVYDDLALQKLVSEGAIGAEVTPATLKQLLTAGRIKPQIAAEDVAFLKQYGIFKSEVQWLDGELHVAERKIGATIG